MAATTASAEIPWLSLSRRVTAFSNQRLCDANMLLHVSEIEVEYAVSASRHHAATGIDGLDLDVLRPFFERPLVLKGPTVDEGFETDKEPRLLTSVLVMLLDCCHSLCMSPSDWRTAQAVLLPKPNKDLTDARSWRHIVLSSAVYKLYAHVLAARLTNFATVPGRLSMHQRGFLPYLGGVHPHVFTLVRAFEDARRYELDLSVMFVDLVNAFGSVEVDVIAKGLELLRVPSRWLALVKDLYGSLRMWFREYGRQRQLEDGHDEFVELERGVRQGCPLSPIIFIVVINPLLLWLELADDPGRPLGYSFARDSNLSVAHLTFADDICLLARDAGCMRTLIRRLEVFLRWARMSCNVPKCALLSVVGGRVSENCANPLHLQLQAVPMLAAEGDRAHYKYLGHWLSFGLDWSRQRREILSKLEARLAAIASSGLPPLAKIDTIGMWAYPVVVFSLLGAELGDKWLQNEVDKRIMAAARGAFSSASSSALPPSVPSAAFYLRRSRGGFGLHRARAQCLLMRLTFLLSLLGSPPHLHTAPQFAFMRRVAERSLLDSASDAVLKKFFPDGKPPSVHVPKPSLGSRKDRTRPCFWSSLSKWSTASGLHLRGSAVVGGPWRVDFVMAPALSLGPPSSTGPHDAPRIHQVEDAPDVAGTLAADQAFATQIRNQPAGAWVAFTALAMSGSDDNHALSPPLAGWAALLVLPDGRHVSKSGAGSPFLSTQHLRRSAYALAVLLALRLACQQLSSVRRAERGCLPRRRMGNQARTTITRDQPPQRLVLVSPSSVTIRACLGRERSDVAPDVFADIRLELANFCKLHGEVVFSWGPELSNLPGPRIALRNARSAADLLGRLGSASDRRARSSATVADSLRVALVDSLPAGRREDQVALTWSSIGVDAARGGCLAQIVRALQSDKEWCKLIGYRKRNFIVDSQALSARLSNGVWASLSAAVQPSAWQRRVVDARFNCLPWSRQFVNGRVVLTRCPFGCSARETRSHVLSGCLPRYGGAYTKRHDAVVRKISAFLSAVWSGVLRAGSREVRTNVSNSSRSSNAIPAGALPPCHELASLCPDIMLVSRVMGRPHVDIIEVGVTAESSLDWASAKKISQYSQLCQAICDYGVFTCSYRVLLVGCLGLIPATSYKVLYDLVPGSWRGAKSAVVQTCRALSSIAARASWDILRAHAAFAVARSRSAAAPP
jgi:hypothetical protein